MNDRDEMMRRVRAHTASCRRLTQALESWPNFSSVRCGSDGNRKPVLIVTLTESPPQGWQGPITHYDDFPVIWKAAGNLFAL